ncbi:hypothetical protein WJX72_005543 [[Myrmecia] bisecta]|uniref:Uncharacterized protein n=1 Tax=[Myrmecia] bisecta TaxID=41462 RepID=A0AAW1PTS9_9CHLO
MRYGVLKDALSTSTEYEAAVQAAQALRCKAEAAAAAIHSPVFSAQLWQAVGLRPKLLGERRNAFLEAHGLESQAGPAGPYSVYPRPAQQQPQAEPGLPRRHGREDATAYPMKDGCRRATDTGDAVSTGRGGAVSKSGRPTRAAAPAAGTLKEVQTPLFAAHRHIVQRQSSVKEVNSHDWGEALAEFQARASDTPRNGGSSADLDDGSLALLLHQELNAPAQRKCTRGQRSHSFSIAKQPGLGSAMSVEAAASKKRKREAHNHSHGSPQRLHTARSV